MGSGPDEVGQKGLKLLHLWCHSQNIQNPKPNFFLLQTRKPAEFFEDLNSCLSTIGRGVMPFLRHMRTAWFWLKPYQLRRC